MRAFNPMVGNDPELFIKKGIRLVPAESLLGPKVIIPAFVKIDNAAIEIHPGPNTCLQSQNANLASQLSAVRALLTKEHRISLRASERLRPIDIKKYKSLTSFGCEPSLVFHPKAGLITSTPNVDPLKVRERSIGYHVHLGTMKPEAVKNNIAAYVKMHPNSVTDAEPVPAPFKDTLFYANLLHTTEGRVRLVRACDLFVGLPAVLIDRDNRQLWRRRLLGYGKAGEFREQPHGFEYRTLGPWPLHHPALTWLANAMVRDAFHMVINDVDLEIVKRVNMLEVAGAINNNSLVRAIPIWNQIKSIAGSFLDSRGWGSHPWTTNVIRYFEFMLVNGGIKFILENNDLITSRYSVPVGAKKNDVWDCKTKESGDREWASYHFGFPSTMDVISQNIQIRDTYNKFTKEWSLEKDVLSKAML